MTVSVISVEGLLNSVIHAGSSMLTKYWGTVILGKTFGDIRLARVNDILVNRPDGKSGYRGTFLAELQEVTSSNLVTPTINDAGQRFCHLACFLVYRRPAIGRSVSCMSNRPSRYRV